MDISKISYKELKTLIDINTFTIPQLKDLSCDMIHDSRKNIQLLGNKIINSIEKQEKEIIRVEKMYNFDKSFPYVYIAGVDEVGRGPFAGPIVAAAVILDLNSENKFIEGINDSKAIQKKQRELLSEEIKSKALAFNISIIGNKIIDEKGIGFSNIEVLKNAVLGLKLKPDFVLSDGFPVNNIGIENKHIIKGDATSANIACASIIAKVFRDSIMDGYDNIYPEYGFKQNSGYGTEYHRNAIAKYGITDIHRKSFLKNYI